MAFGSGKDEKYCYICMCIWDFIKREDDSILVCPKCSNPYGTLRADMKEESNEKER